MVLIYLIPLCMMVHMNFNIIIRYGYILNMDKSTINQCLSLRDDKFVSKLMRIFIPMSHYYKSIILPIPIQIHNWKPVQIRWDLLIINKYSRLRDSNFPYYLCLKWYIVIKDQLVEIIVHIPPNYYSQFDLCHFNKIKTIYLAFFLCLKIILNWF